MYHSKRESTTIKELGEPVVDNCVIITDSPEWWNLADTHGLGPCAKYGMQVQVLSPVLVSPDGETGRHIRFKL